MPGNQVGISWGKSFLALNTTDKSVNSKAIQVITPITNNSLERAFARIFGSINPTRHEKSQPGTIGLQVYEITLIYGLKTLIKADLLPTVVWSLAGNGYIVRVTFRYPGRRDFNKLGFLQCLDVFGSAIAHTGPQATHHLVKHL